ncbi:hypothetical protein QJS66_17155 [Kocuria rhizophila]|nr:hypothetical protein QJS66_17155 [Kocuria rhizophila]
MPSPDQGTSTWNLLESANVGPASLTERAQPTGLVQDVVPGLEEAVRVGQHWPVPSRPTDSRQHWPSRRLAGHGRTWALGLALRRGDGARAGLANAAGPRRSSAREGPATQLVRSLSRTGCGLRWAPPPSCRSRRLNCSR